MTENSILIQVQLDENKMPDEINWSAPDSSPENKLGRRLPYQARPNCIPGISTWEMANIFATILATHPDLLPGFANSRSGDPLHKLRPVCGIRTSRSWQVQPAAREYARKDFPLNLVVILWRSSCLDR